MTDMFGEWVPGDWLVPVFEMMSAADWHQFFVLTRIHAASENSMMKQPIGILVAETSYQTCFSGYLLPTKTTIGELMNSENNGSDQSSFHLNHFMTKLSVT